MEPQKEVNDVTASVEAIMSVLVQNFRLSPQQMEAVARAISEALLRQKG